MPCVLLNNSDWIFGTYKLNVLTWLELLLLCMIFYLCSYSDFFFFLSSLLNYRHPYCIQLYTWSTQKVIVAQHMCSFLKASNPQALSIISTLSHKMVYLFPPYIIRHTQLFNLTSYYYIYIYIYIYLCECVCVCLYLRFFISIYFGNRWHIDASFFLFIQKYRSFYTNFSTKKIILRDSPTIHICN